MTKGYHAGSRRSPNEKAHVLCKECNEEREHHAKGLCAQCYRKQYKPKTVECRNCGENREHKAFGLCATCHTKLYHYAAVRRYEQKKNFSVTEVQCSQITNKCQVCNFTKIVHIHRLDGNSKNNHPQNLIGLCPNCKSMLQSKDYFSEISKKLQKSGVDISKLQKNHLLN